MVVFLAGGGVVVVTPSSWSLSLPLPLLLPPLPLPLLLPPLELLMLLIYLLILVKPSFN